MYNIRLYVSEFDDRKVLRYTVFVWENVPKVLVIQACFLLKPRAAPCGFGTVTHLLLVWLINGSYL
jgi:hypothetical protein